MESRESELKEQLDRLESMGTEWLRGLKRQDNSSRSIVNISAGSWMGVLLMISSAFVLGIAMATSFQVSGRMTKIEGKQDEQDQYLHAIYMMAPQLKPKEKTDGH